MQVSSTIGYIISFQPLSFAGNGAVLDKEVSPSSPSRGDVNAQGAELMGKEQRQSISEEDMYGVAPAAALELIQAESETLRTKLERDISSLEESLSNREKGKYQHRSAFRLFSH
jgi:hypothetical protein